jgi:tetratricopeptide (TPR) repeat protein
MRDWLSKSGTENRVLSLGSYWLGHAELVRGEVQAGLRDFNGVRVANDRMGNRISPYSNAYYRSITASLLLDRNAVAEQVIDSVLRAYPLDSLPVLERPYDLMVHAYAAAGALGKAKQLHARFEQVSSAASGLHSESDRPMMLGNIAFAEGRYQDAIVHFRAANVGYCTTCALPHLARAYDLSNQRDSAIATFSRYVSDSTDTERYNVDQFYLAGAHNRLGELLEEQGRRAESLKHYRAFVELWSNADKELQPTVARARANIARLQNAERR